ncbi:MAG TPA: HupE/UreJ family protein [Flavobacteriaceae bacterium]|nr:HupE/UreJ family protein [Flavobacteriaceae bacterium]
MDQFWLYFKLGLTHVLDWNAYDHVLFLTVLVAAYTVREWPRILWLVTLFTIGHTLALILAAYGVVSVDTAWVEFLIPVTILVTALYNIFTGKKKIRNEKINLLFFTTLFFGVIHGLGFSTYFNMISSGADSKFLLLIEFALGIETAQIIVVFIVLILSFLFQTVFRFSKRDWILVISALVTGLTIPILAENWLW